MYMSMLSSFETPLLRAPAFFKQLLNEAFHDFELNLGYSVWINFQSNSVIAF